jgi:hypothetical protein
VKASHKFVWGTIIVATSFAIAPVAASASEATLGTHEMRADVANTSGEAAIGSANQDPAYSLLMLWGGVGVLGLAAGLVTVTTISRRQRRELSGFPEIAEAPVSA